MHIAVLSGFLLSIAVPSLHRFTRGLTGWIIALLPVGLFAYFASFIPGLAAGETFAVSYSWVPSLGIQFAFYLDGLALLFSLLICLIGALVMIYASSYLEGHPQLGRFYAYLAMFMASMLGVVLSDNIFGLFVFWELTSISSYLLIGFEHEDEEARNAALQALLVTGGGGLALLAGLVLLVQAGGTTQFSELSEQGGALQAHGLYVPILLLVLAGAFTKSAQAPFHFWLPNAMQAPSPVSAYLHSATMVKAGIYLLARLSPVLGGTDAWFYLVAGVGLLTALIGAFLALSHSNLKRILAYSTISSLGTMTLLIGIGGSKAIQAAIVYLLAHALYKGALFLLAGAIYHQTGTQDVDELGGLRSKMPILAGITGLAAISLAGFGPLLSFIGKELVFETLLETQRFSFLFTLGAVLFSAVSVAVALILLIKPFFGEAKSTPHPAHEPPFPLWSGSALLALLGLILGLFPTAIAPTLISPAVNAILGEPQPVKLYLWHGLNLALGLSVVSILLGLALFRLWAVWRSRAARLATRVPWGRDWGYRASLDGLTWTAARLTSVLQSGHLHDYMMTAIATTVVLIGVTMISQWRDFQLPAWSELRFYEAGLAGLILLAAFIVTIARSRLLAVAALGVVGYGMSLLFILFGAPDLAMTQILIESITVILLVLILYHLPGFSKFSSRGTRLRDILIALAAGLSTTLLVLITNAATHFPPISSYYLENSVLLAHGRNIVNTILVDFRALDTLGEITVLSLAAIGVFALLKLRWPETRDKNGE